jgi:hypothetical protein
VDTTKIKKKEGVFIMKWDFKKGLVTLSLASVLSIGLLAGCGGAENPADSGATPPADNSGTPADSGSSDAGATDSDAGATSDSGSSN